MSGVGEAHPAWLGNDATYNAKHRWLQKHMPRTGTCARCKTSEKKLDIACKNGKYTRNFDDYMWLCRKCHFEYDGLVKNLHWHKDPINRSS